MTKYTTLKNVQMAVYILVGLSAFVLIEANKESLKAPKLTMIKLPKGLFKKKETKTA